jgi:similar to stage IV sporulation protein
MIPSLHYLLTGYRTLAVEAAHAARLLELCRVHGYIYEDFGHLKNGGISLRFPFPIARRVAALCERNGIPVILLREGGVPRLCRFLAARAGLLVGLLCGILLLRLAQSVLWDIRISGNQTVSNRALEESLATCGFFVGCSLKDFEADKTENDVLMQDDRLAWISINRKGTVAYVEVREKTQRPPDDTDEPRDIVASIGGVIQRVELEEGNVRVAAGELVGEGDVLVSGIYDSMNQGIRLTAAKARVYARTTRILTVEIPFSYEQKVYETDPGQILSEKSIFFFGNHIKFSKSTGNLGAFCDTIENEKSWGMLGGIGFPISTRIAWQIPYSVVTATRTLAEAEELAYFELARQIAALPGGAELITKSISISHGADALTLTCNLTCIEDIGAVRRIEVAIHPEQGQPP